MSSVWIIYLADVACGLGAFLAIAGLLTAVGLLICLAAGEYELKRLSKYFVLSVFLIIFSIVIPSKKTIYMMAAAKVGQDIVSAPATKEIGDKVLKLINQKLDDSLEKK